MNLMKSNLLLILLVFFIRVSVFSQTSSKDKIKNYDDICFCDVGLSHPQSILNLDNNMELLFALKNGHTLPELNELGIKFTYSQIKLLKLSDLIEKRDSIYQTKIPILTNNETIKLREQTIKLASKIIPSIKKNFEYFSNTLESKGLQRNTYSIFFSFIIDGLVWDVLEQNANIGNISITKEKPFWNGVYWIIQPKRNFSCGTNSLSTGNFTIHENWSYQWSTSMTDFDMLEMLLNDYKTNGKITKPEIIKEFTKNELFNKNGIIQIPVIKADSADVIYQQSKNIAKDIAKYLKENIDYSLILSDYKTLTNEQKLIISYHEIMWDILDIMESEKQIKKPIAFANPQEAKPSDLKDLLFIVEN